MNTDSPTWPYEWMGGAAGLLHTLLHTDDGRALLAKHHQLEFAEKHYAFYRQWISRTLADAEARFGVDAA